MLNIPVRFIDPDLYSGENTIQKIGGSKSDWIDLRCSKDIVLRPFEFTIIPLGVAMQLPEGYEALLLPRSSTFKKYQLLQTNSMGVIDEKYAGDNDEWGMPVIHLALPPSDVVIVPRGERICQFRIVHHQPDVHFIHAEHLSQTDRGGFGSTGRI